MNVFVSKTSVVERAAVNEEFHEELNDLLVNEDLADGGVGARFETSYNDQGGEITVVVEPVPLFKHDLPERLSEPVWAKPPATKDDSVPYKATYNYNKEELVTIDSAPSLWMIECRVGSEEEALISLFRMFDKSEYSPASAIFSIPGVKGYLFIEAQWNEIPSLLVEKLYEVDSVISADRPGPIHLRRISSDMTKYLWKTCRTSRAIQVGDWRRLRFAEYNGQQRLYRNEMALVVDSNTFFAVVLIVPLIPTTGIRELSIWNKPKLDYVRMRFDRKELKVNYRQKTTEDNSFECGLWIRRVPVKNILPASERLMTEHEFLPFADSRHPCVISNFPRILEWEFSVGEEVAYWWDETLTGFIRSVSDEGPIVVSADGTENDWGWALLKLWTAGSEVVAPDGYLGVIQHFLGSSAQVWDTETYDFIHKTPICRYFHTNSLKRASGIISTHIPDLFAYKKKRQLNPWRNMAVRVVAGPCKGRYEFLDTISGTNTKSTYKASVRSAILNSQAIRTVDYDWVVCEETGFALHKVRRVEGWILEFPPGYKHPHQTVPALPAPTLPKLSSDPIAPTDIRTPRFSVDPSYYTIPSPVASGSNTREKTPPPFQDRQESQRWLWELDTIGYKFKVTILRDPKDIKVHLCVEEASDAFNTKRIYWTRHNKDHELHHLVDIVPETPTRKAERPFFVMSGEHKGKTMVRVKGRSGELLSLEVDVFEGTIKSEEYFTVGLLDCCMLVMDNSKWKLLERALDPFRDEMC